MMQRRIEQIPALSLSGRAWREAYRSAAAHPKPRRWIAALHAGEVNHAVVVNGQGRILYDPNGHELNGLPVPRDRLLFGLRVVPANAPETDRWGKATR